MGAALPFTADQFFEVFAVYNDVLWPAVVAWWLLALTAVAAAWMIPSASRWLMRLLALLWLWNGLVYHAWLFSAINPAAWGFAVLFLIQAALLVSASRREVQPFFTARGWRQPLGSALAVYAFLYPFLTIAVGHRFPATPTFGVPCPTAIMTIGLLLTIPTLPVRLTIIPAMWALVGGSAAYLLRVPTDYVLLGAGVLLGSVGIHQRYLSNATRTSPQ
jgi:hypothetical protein